ncbi:MAG TPA: transposase [Blastocatellia bacterium]|nr:transposase [Blastocatellia bacterium]
MDKDKYVGMDVHKAMTVVAVLDGSGRLVAEAIIETRSETIKDFVRGLSGKIHLTFEEGTQSAWLYELIKPLVAELIVCDPRRNKLMAMGNKSDKVDAKKLAELLRAGSLNGVYHGDAGTKKLKEVVRLYLTLMSDAIRVMNRIKAIYRGRGIATTGASVYRAESRLAWIAHILDEGSRVRLEALYRQLDFLSEQRKHARREVVTEVRRHAAYRILNQIPSLGPIRIAIIIAVVVSPHRFRTKRQFWPYCGFGVVTVTSSEYVTINGKICRSKKPAGTRGLNHNYNRHLKSVFKDAAQYASRKPPFKQHYDRLIAKNMRKQMAMLTLARKISAITLAVWKAEDCFDSDRLSNPDKVKEVVA